MPPKVPPGPGILGLQIRNLIPPRTRKSDVQMLVLGERELLMYHFHEGQGQAVNLKDTSCRGLECAGGSSHLPRILNLQFVFLFGFVFKYICISILTLFSLPPSPCFSPTPLRKHSSDKTNEKYDKINHIVLMLSLRRANGFIKVNK